MSDKIEPSIFGHLGALEEAVQELAHTWRPGDPHYRADLYRQIMMNLSYSYFAYFHADAEHPDWAPLWNPVYTCQPNPDDIYLYSPIRGDLTYRVSGNRGTVRKLIFVTQHGMAGMVDELSEFYDVKCIDETDFEVGPDGEFELIFSTERPPGYSGNWTPLGPGADTIFLRYRSYDWANERDPQLTIECLDDVPPKPRLRPGEIIERIERMAKFPVRSSRIFLTMQNAIKAKVGINHFDPVNLPGLDRQVYWPAVFELDADEALIIETELPAVRPYWNIQLNDPYFNAVEYVYRLSSLNGHTARISTDGKFRAVIAMTDPGVPNWLDPAGFGQGTIYGRWYDCDSTPTPVITRVKLAALRQHLPADTPVVTAAERAEELRIRVRAAQRRRRW
jgi:Protein of unknown function (DUF1214)